MLTALMLEQIAEKILVGTACQRQKYDTYRDTKTHYWNRKFLVML